MRPLLIWHCLWSAYLRGYSMFVFYLQEPIISPMRQEQRMSLLPYCTWMDWHSQWQVSRVRSGFVSPYAAPLSSFFLLVSAHAGSPQLENSQVHCGLNCYAGSWAALPGELGTLRSWPVAATRCREIPNCLNLLPCLSIDVLYHVITFLWFVGHFYIKTFQFNSMGQLIL